MSKESDKRRKRLDFEGTEPKEVRAGVWQSTVMLGYKPNGDRLRKTVTEASADACRREVSRLVRDYESGVAPTVGKSMTLSAWMAHNFRQRELAEDVTAQTLKGYRSKIRTYVDQSRLGRVRLSKLTVADLERQYRSMRADGLGVSTVRHLHAILRKSLDTAVRQSVMSHNPALRAVLPRRKKTDHVGKAGDSLTVGEAKRLLQVVDTSLEPARWLIGLLLGPRQSEVLALAWDRVHPEVGRIRIDRKLFRLTWEHGCLDAAGRVTCSGKRGADCPARFGGGLFLAEPKSEAGVREIPLPEVIVQALWQQWDKHARWEAEDGRRATWEAPDGQEYDLVFKQRNGRPWDPSRDWDQFKLLLVEAGLDDARVQDLRHTAATMLLVQGVDSRVVMEIMGWSQISMLKRYQHVLDELRSDAVDRVADALTAPDEGSTPPESTGTVVGLDAWKQARSQREE